MLKLSVSKMLVRARQLVVEVRGLSSRKGHCKGMLFLGEKGDGIDEYHTVPKKSRILEGSSSESLLEKRKNHTYTHT